MNCKVKNCERPAEASGWCTLHGDPLGSLFSFVFLTPDDVYFLKICGTKWECWETLVGELEEPYLVHVFARRHF